MSQMQPTVKKLCQASIQHYSNPYEQEWSETLDPDCWYTSPELISLYGLDAYNNLTELEQKRLSFFEAVNFFSLNINGEKAFVQGLTPFLYKKAYKETSAYMHHFLDEENKHMIYFGNFCMRYAGKVYQDKKMMFNREYAKGEEEFLFFTKVMVFEEISDAHNIKMSKDDRLAPIARKINLMHHQDETRHLVFGRQMVKDLFETHSPNWSQETMKGIREYVKNYILATWKEYYNPEVYTDSGLSNAFQLREAALLDPNCRQHREKMSSKCIKFLLENKILLEVPSL